jgi:anti-sigma regulatory factor (Ser/Thr protein kinase)
VMLSGYERSRFWPEAAKSGAVAYLEKGIPPDTLVDHLLAAAGVLEVVESAISQAHTRLAADLQSAGSARHFVDETLRRWDCGERLEIVSLLVSELVTNAVVHAHSDVEVVVRMTGANVRIDVLDHSNEHPVVRSPSVYDTSGRGLALVESLASRWGVDPRPGGGKSVWFEVPALDVVQ